MKPATGASEHDGPKDETVVEREAETENPYPYGTHDTCSGCGGGFHVDDLIVVEAKGTQTVWCERCRTPNEELLTAEPLVSDELVELGAVLLHHWTRIRCVQLAVDAVDLGGQQKIEDVLVLAKEYERWITGPPNGDQDEEER